MHSLHQLDRPIPFMKRHWPASEVLLSVIPQCGNVFGQWSAPLQRCVIPAPYTNDFTYLNSLCSGIETWLGCRSKFLGHEWRSCIPSGRDFREHELCQIVYHVVPLHVTRPAFTVSSWRSSALDRHLPPITAIGWRLDVCHKKNINASRRQEFFRRWTVSLELSACRITWQRYLTCTV